jgi:hypothetical protein
LNAYSACALSVGSANKPGLEQMLGSDMVLDEYDMMDEKQDIAIITPAESPDEAGTAAEIEPEPMADDCEMLQPV